MTRTNQGIFTMTDLDRDIVALKRRMSPLQMKRWALAQRLAQFMHACDEARQPAWLHSMEHKQHLASTGTSFEQSRFEGFANLFCVQPSTLKSLLRGDLVNAWAWDLVEWCLGENGELPTWGEARARKGERW